MNYCSTITTRLLFKVVFFTLILNLGTNCDEKSDEKVLFLYYSDFIPKYLHSLNQIISYRTLGVVLAFESDNEYNTNNFNFNFNFNLEMKYLIKNLRGISDIYNTNIILDWNFDPVDSVYVSSIRHPLHYSFEQIKFIQINYRIALERLNKIELYKKYFKEFIEPYNLFRNDNLVIIKSWIIQYKILIIQKTICDKLDLIWTKKYGTTLSSQVML